MSSFAAGHRAVGHSVAVVPEIVKTTVAKDKAVTTTNIGRRVELRRAVHHTIVDAIVHSRAHRPETTRRRTSLTTQYVAGPLARVLHFAFRSNPPSGIAQSHQNRAAVPRFRFSIICLRLTLKRNKYFIVISIIILFRLHNTASPHL